MGWPSASARTKNWGSEILTDADLEAQLDLLHSYFNDSLNATTGHGHTGGVSDAPKLVLTAGASVTGTLPATLGGTGTATIAQGEIFYGSAANVISKLAVGTSGQFLKTLGAAANPAWATPVLKVKNGSLTRDTTVASGNVSYTGVGFTPTTILFIMCLNSASQASIGFDDGTTPVCLIAPATAWTSSVALTTPSSIYYSNAGNNTYAKIASFDADGFTLTWTKVASSTGTIQVMYIALSI